VELNKLLRSVAMFAGLTDEEFSQLAGLFQLRQLADGEILFQQGETGDSLCLIQQGFVEIVTENDGQEKTLVNLGPGQSVGEMALIDRGARSATVRAATSDTIVAVVSRDSFEKLCEQNTSIGYKVMRNIAADLSFRIRHRSMDS
jgi:CRP-like cAMP-binding protein